MIRIIKTLRAQSLDLGDGKWVELPLVPATGLLEISRKTEAAGRLATAKISATLTREDAILADNMILEVRFCEDGDSVETFGSADLPLRLDISTADTVKVSASWSWPER
ncbi:MAG: hypothetical protein IJ840_00190 [Bacteroidales bacterium]|nr:hypothetical protein [Bacteroidales bacterium]